MVSRQAQWAEDVPPFLWIFPRAKSREEKREKMPATADWSSLKLRRHGNESSAAPATETQSGEQHGMMDPGTDVTLNPARPLQAPSAGGELSPPDDMKTVLTCIILRQEVNDDSQRDGAAFCSASGSPPRLIHATQTDGGYSHQQPAAV
ncbi:unnamed protein product [Pleuronectes platessa]|uniref:Uncharacterized protein n=1 Tax=Pleuronectes platessa TaxID=8262 RepID=A0A9N7ZC80_PLEPL|nr:unnamed protein product [Pleuronectes platessa]